MTRSPMLHNSPTTARRAVSHSLAAALLLAGGAAGQTLDYTVSSVDIVQVIPNVTLVDSKPAFVRAHVAFTGAQSDDTVVDGVLRVFVNGAEEAYSPVFSDNGPFAPPQNISTSNENHTLNFIFQPPATGDLVVMVEINPAGPNRVPEIDFTNNTFTSSSFAVVSTGRPRLTYVPIDYRPSGGGANLPDPLLIEPGAGDNFIQGIFPTEDWNYHRSDVPSKLWTNNLNNTGSGLLSSLLTDLNMMVPQPDFIYGWVPGSLPYNGQAIGIPGKAAMGNTQTIRHQRTFAHELGHLLGRSHIGNTIGVSGVDVEHQLNITEGLPRIKISTLFDVMVAGLLTNQAWCYNVNYEFYIIRPVFSASEERAVPAPGEHLLVAGLWDREAGSFELTDTVAFEGAIPTETVPITEADLIVRVHSGGRLSGEFGMRVNPATDSCASADTASKTTPEAESADSEEGAGPIAAFVAVLPTSVDPATVERIEIVDGRTQVRLAELLQSDTKPSVTFDTPRLVKRGSDEVVLGWTAQDPDGETLRHYLRYSPDGVRLSNLATATQETDFRLDMASLPEVQAGKGYFEVLTTDGLHTTSVRMPAIPGGSQQRLGAINPPWTEILTPDQGMSFRKRATVILHCSGWDLEDRSIEGASIVWTSDVDGLLGTGRVLSVTDLSVGAHVITVTATDSSGLLGTDTSAITISNRPVPLSAFVATRNAGANPTSYVAELPVLGATWNATIDLSTTGHTAAQLFIFDAPANITLGGGQVLLVGGTQVVALPLMTGPIVNISELIPNDPLLVGLTFYTQAVHVLGVTPYALSNSQDLTVGF